MHVQCGAAHRLSTTRPAFKAQYGGTGRASVSQHARQRGVGAITPTTRAEDVPCPGRVPRRWPATNRLFGAGVLDDAHAPGETLPAIY